MLQRFYARAMRELWKDRGNCVSFMLATGVSALAHAAMAVSAGLLGQALVGSGPDAPLGAGAATGLFGGGGYSPSTLCLVGFSAASVKALAGAMAIYGQRRAGFQVGGAIRGEIARRVLVHGGLGTRVADSHAAIVVRIREIERGVDEGVLSGTRALVQLLPLGAALVALSSPMALGAIAALVPFGLALAWARRRFRRGYVRAGQLAEALHAGVDELVRHVDLWRTYGAGGRVEADLERAGREAAHASASAEATRGALSGANEALAAAALLAVVLSARALGWDLRADAAGGSLIAFAAVFFLTYRPLRDLGDARGQAERGALALDALDAMLPATAVQGDRGERRARSAARAGASDLPAAVSTACTAPSAAGGREAPTGSRWALERLVVDRLHVVRGEWATPPTSFVAEPGEIVLVVGPTGSGKTSLLRALLGLEPGAVGSVRYGRARLDGAGAGPARRPFAWVPQESAIVAGTAVENVALGLGDAAGDGALERARAALEEVGASALAARADRLAAGGFELSGGQRQWVSLARALVSGQPVLLLDEPTSGLDAASQARVLESLRALRGRRTVILVTHRPEPLAIADRIVTLGDAPAAGDGGVTVGALAPSEPLDA